MSQPFSRPSSGAGLDYDPDVIGLPAVAPPRGLWGLWLRLTMPRPPRGLPNATQRERLRRARLLSVLLLATIVVVLILFPKAFIPALDPGTLQGVILALVIVIASGIVNKRGHINAAGLTFVLGVATAIALSLIFTPIALGMQDLPTFDLFTVPVVMAAILLPRRAAFFIWFICAAFTVLDMIFQPHQANLEQYIAQVGLYATIVLPVLSTGVIAVVSWLAAGSVQRAITEADRTVGLEQAAQVIAEQKRRLEEAVSVIQNVHARVANGDLAVRAPVHGGELVPLAISLNLMLERLARSQAAESTLGGLEMNVQRLGMTVAELAQGRIMYPVPQDGLGRLTPIAFNLEQLRAGILQVTRQCHTLAGQIAQAHQHVMANSGALAQYAQQTFGSATAPAVRELPDRLARASQDLTQTVEQLQAYLARFAP